MTTIYNTTSQIIGTDGTYQLTDLANQKGSCTKQLGNGIVTTKGGLYSVTGTVTGLVTGGGTITASVAVNGKVEPYLTATSYSNTNEPTTVTISGTYVASGVNCSGNTSNSPIFTLVNNGDNTVITTFASLNVTKL